jgi:tyrosine-specific transport protein
MSSDIKKVFSGSLLIAGTMIGAGMLGIPLVTAQAGIIPACGITVFVWFYMLCTGLLFLEVTLWMHKGANIISMTKSLLGREGKIFAAAVFVFLYYCLMVAYFSAGAPLFASFINIFFGVKVAGILSYAVFAIIFGVIVGVGLKFIDRVNYILMVGLVASYIALIGGGSSSIDVKNLEYVDFSKMIFAAPILFSSFGFHNVIPSVTHHFDDNGKIMRKAIFWGTFIPLIVYLLWQFLIIGIIPQTLIETTLAKGEPITSAMLTLTGNNYIKVIGRFFGFFAIITSMIGVSFSVVDFLGDGLSMRRFGFHRFLLCLLTFIPPFVLSIINPSVFVLAIGIAGGFGEAFLNGILPAWLVWIGRYQRKKYSQYKLPGGKVTLAILLVIGFVVMAIEGIIIGSHKH